MSGYAEMANNPPPPGTHDDSNQAEWQTQNRRTVVVDPFIKNPEYERYQKRSSRSPDHKRGRHHRGEKRRFSRSRSSSYERHHSRRKRDYKNDSRSSRRRKSHSSSRSHSPSPSRQRRPSRRSPSREKRARRSRSSSRDAYRSRHTKRHRSKSRESYEQQYQHYYPRVSKDYDGVETQDVDTTVEEEEEPEPPKDNLFKNDGSFMETFKRMQEEQQRKQLEETQENQAEIMTGASTSVPRAFAGIGKRRGGRILKTGIVAKPKVEEESGADEPQDAWSIYLKEVKRYKEACCDDDSKTRPLVK